MSVETPVSANCKSMGTVGGMERMRLANNDVHNKAVVPFI